MESKNIVPMAGPSPAAATTTAGPARKASPLDDSRWPDNYLPPLNLLLKKVLQPKDTNGAKLHYINLFEDKLDLSGIRRRLVDLRDNYAQGRSIMKQAYEENRHPAIHAMTKLYEDFDPVAVRLDKAIHDQEMRINIMRDRIEGQVSDLSP